MIEPLRLSFVADCPVEHAFAVWTAKTSQWWPVTHTVTSERGLAVVFEGRDATEVEMLPHFVAACSGEALR